MRPPVLIVLHGELSTPGRVAIQLRNRDIPLDVRRPRFGDELPKTLDGHTGAVIFGGPQSANDDDEIVKREIEWIGIPLKEKKPFLGICLGAQMLAKQLGARVYKHPDSHAEIGYYPIKPTAAGRGLCRDWPSHVYQWHREGFDLPDKTVLLVSHDLEEAVYLADEVLLLTKRPTRVAEILRYEDPRPRTVATLSEPSFVSTKKRSLEIFQREVRR